MIITIDGPIATGKSTIAKKLAQEIGFIYVDTGAMYRCLAYSVLKHEISPSDVTAIIDHLNSFKFDIKIRHGKKSYYVNDEDVTDIIRGKEVTSKVSQISAIEEVREKLVDLQREYSKGINAVFEGRDMGTVVFPEADVKIFLKGDPVIRAKRRYEELKKKYPEDFKELTLEQTISDINKRDHQDSTREVSPLKQAEDALVIDTTELSIEDIITKILEYKDTKPYSAK
ncbi:MAG: (d)CMP kinase [Chlamydiota bacterium]